jgi:polysaccharide deacetylase family protein (PEP-CTERM system associated)
MTGVGRDLQQGAGSRPKGRDTLNAMTVDVEDYFQVEAFSGRISRGSWERIPRRIETNIGRILELFAAAKVGATFFTLGWVAERHPGMMREIATGGHEIACHGYDHVRVDRLGPQVFRDDVRRSKRILEDIVGLPVFGYRAPTFSLGIGTDWAYDILESEGYQYSSSVYPIRHDLYGNSAAPRAPFRPANRALWELPLTTRRLFGQNIPSAGGGYFRLFPYAWSRWNLDTVNRREARASIFYFHPWEIDAEQPRIRSIGLRTRLRHYTNLGLMPARIERLLREFRWGRIDKVFDDRLNEPSQSRALG